MTEALHSWLIYEVAKSHLNRNLGAGAQEHHLSRLIEPLVHGGRFYLLAHSQLDHDRERNLHWAGTYCGMNINDFYKSDKCRIDDSEELNLILLLGRFIEQTGGSVIIENPYVRRTDPCASKLDSKHLFFEDEVYHVVDRYEREEILQAMTDAELAPYLTGLCSYSALPNVAELHIRDLQHLVRHLAMVFTTALDGEGYLIWTPEGELPSRAATTPRRR